VKLFKFLKNIFSPSAEKQSARLVGEFHRQFGYRFQNVNYLMEAMTHRSYVRSIDHKAHSNERLEFLGDSILGTIMAEHLFRSNSDFDEGDLTKMRAQLVNETSLAAVSVESGLNKFILISPDEERTGGRERNSIVSDAFEAVIGAVYLDGGLSAAREFIKRVLISRKIDILTNVAQRNYKGELLEYLQGKGEPPPYYEVVSESGPDHEKIFNIAVRTNGTIVGTGVGGTKKEAEQNAAADAMENIQTAEFTDPEKED
jgi:ribonuclease III